MILKTRAIRCNKAELCRIPATTLDPEPFIFIPLTNTRCAKAELSIKEGDQVYVGETIGLRHGAFFDQPILSTVSGIYQGLEKHGYRNGKVIDYLKIQNDKKDTLDPSIHERTDEDIAKLTKDQITDIVKAKALVGLGGSSFPTYVKFQTKNPIKYILINGIECEPFLTSDHRFMVEHADEILGGIKIMQQAFACEDARICFKGVYTELVDFWNDYLAKNPVKGVSISLMDNYYPQGWETAMIKKAVGVDVPSGHLPSEYGVINFNVATAAGVYFAVKKDLPVLDREVSVYGEGIKHPSNYVVRIGTPFKTLIEKSGGYVDEKNDDKILIVGGPMMGGTIPNDDCVVSPTVTSLLIQKQYRGAEEPCIHCGSCVYSCPVGLEPVTIMRAMRPDWPFKVSEKYVKSLNVMKCMECGLCTYSCTSKIPLLAIIREAKLIARKK
jgi:electron transport complex protein RnfC